MAAGFLIYSFDWTVFADLTSNAKSRIPTALAELLQDGKIRKKLRLSSKLPSANDKLSSLIRDLFLKPEWFIDQPSSEVTLRHQLLFGMFHDKALKSLGLSAAPTWRAFHECCSFDVGYLLAGAFALNLERMKKSSGAYFKILDNAARSNNAFRWLGNRPFRHGEWHGSNEDQEELEEEYGCNVHSIQSPEEVDSLAQELVEQMNRYEQIQCAELQELLADYKHCIEGVRKKNAGMLVEVDT